MNGLYKSSIIKKVADILNNVGCAESVSIDIRYSPDEEPSITYKIKESITVEKEEVF